MSVLHSYFNLRRQNDFQRCLEQSKASASSSTGSQVRSGSGSGPGSTSWTKTSSFSTPVIDVNSRDWLGRAVLHLACSAVDPAALEYTRLLLAHPQINVNIQDQESLWTPLHRALYSGNVPAAVLLLQRSDTDMFLKDVEGYTPFDVYNSTVAGTNPAEAPVEGSNAELYTWGSNRNAALGFGDGDDRALPQQVMIKPFEGSTQSKVKSGHPLSTLKAVPVVNVAMSKLHTTIITGEAKGNLRSCGFSSTGRLGSGGSSTSYSQFSFLNPQESLPHKIVGIALGQDHTLAVTSSGEVLSWGLNRFHQLGYAFEGKSNAQEDQIQSAARKITGPLRNQVVVGVACCKTASVCWTATQLFSWGTNHGQLGYERTGQPQIIPRLVSCVSEPVLGVAITDSVMLVLLKSRDVICLHEGNYWKLQFPAQRSLRAHKVVAKERTEIRKVIACEGSVGNFALVSEAGDVYLFNIEEVPAQRKDAGKDAGIRRPVPHLVWAVRRQFTAVKDVALGADGSMILCTKSGHVFVRSRILRAGIGHGSGSLVNPPKNAPIFKFHRVPNLQRIIKVCANSNGAFAALRLDAIPNPIPIDGAMVADDFNEIQPFRSWASMFSKKKPTDINETMEQLDPLIPSAREDDDVVDVDIVPDIHAAMDLCDSLTHILSSPPCITPNKRLRPLAAHYGADLFFQIGDCSIPAHSAVLLMRAPAIRDVLRGKSVTCGTASMDRRKIVLNGLSSSNRDLTIKVTGCSPMTILILCYYLYTDAVVTIWDRRVTLAILDQYGSLNIDVFAIRSELQLLASQFKLHNLEAATKLVGKISHTPTFGADLQYAFAGDHIIRDVVLHLDDTTVKAHSFVLRSRCLYFATFFNEECWTENRLKAGAIEIDLKGFKSLPMSYLFRYLYGEVTPALFSNLDFVHTSDQFIDFMFEVISCSNHFLLDRLTDLCSAQILQLVDLRNVSAVLIDASHLNATPLVKRLHGYMCENLETLMEMHALDELPQDLLKALSKFLRAKQTSFHPYIRGGANVPALEHKWERWSQLQDFPLPFVPRYLLAHHRQAGLPTLRTMPSRDVKNMQPPSPTDIRQQGIAKGRDTQGEEEMFPMDGDIPSNKPLAATASPHKQQPSSPNTPRVWKSPTTSERVDMRTIMEAERQAADAKRQPLATGSPSHEVSARKWVSRSTAENMQRAGQTPVGSMDSSPPIRKLVTTPSAATPSRPSPQPIHRKGIPEGTNSPSRPVLTPQQKTGGIPSSPSDNRVPSSSTPISTTGGGKRMNVSKDQVSIGVERSLGPLIVPVKTSTVPKPPVRRNGSGEGLAWSNSRPAIPAPKASSQSLSFAAIQEQQAAKAPVAGPPKSLREIQEEEQEIAFLTWFESESARIKKQEEEALSAVVSGPHSKQSNKANQSKRGRGGRDRGRGKGRSQGRGMPELAT